MSNDKDVIHLFDECPESIIKIICGDAAIDARTRLIIEDAYHLGLSDGSHKQLVAFKVKERSKHHKLPRYIRYAITLAVVGLTAYLLSL